MRSVWVVVLLCGMLCRMAQADSVTVQAEGANRRILATRYEAKVAANGSLTNLKIGGVEFLQPNVSISRGTYFFQNGVVEIPTVEQPSANVVTAKGEKASVRYEFAPDTLTWTVSNATDAPMSFFIILDPAVAAVRSDQGEYAKAGVQREWQGTTWFRGKSRLHITGSTRQWPWEGGTQVWEATLGPKETRKIVLEAGATSDAEAQQIAGLGIASPGALPDLLVLSPKHYQVFQRRTRLSGTAVFSGRIKPACDRLETRITGASLRGPLPEKWQPLPFDTQTRSFNTELPLAAGGWYKVELRALNKGKTVAQMTVDKVGMGEVFVGAGQSNSTNSGQERINQTSGMVSSFSGSDWRIANDPQPGVHDRSGGGSFWPAFGDALFEKYKVPIGIASTGHGGTSVNQWQPDGELFNWMMVRIQQLGYRGFRAVLWHQGESDTGMSSDDYAQRLTNVIEGSTLAAGWQFPWFIAQVSYHNPNELSFASTRDAQKRLWESGIALEGPDTDTLTGDNRDFAGKGIHFSPKGLRAHGKMWADKISAYLDRVLTDK